VSLRIRNMVASKSYPCHPERSEGPMQQTLLPPALLKFLTMPSQNLPALSPNELAWVSYQVSEFIRQQRMKYLPTAAPLSNEQKSTLRPFFPDAILDSARLFTLSGTRIPNPDFYETLLSFGLDSTMLPDFSNSMAAVTFQDVIVSHEPFTDRLLFHELVHVVQYSKLGLSGFATKYVEGFLQGGGYEGIPLEINAYHLDSEFAAHPEKHFSVESEVQSWIASGKF
jgi:hypothetical protein